MSLILSLALLLGAPSAQPADTFAARVTHGKLVEVGPTGPAYQKTLWRQLDGPVTAALKSCIARHAPADKSPFTVVADIRPDGAPRRVDAQPATPLASCFARWLATQTLPPPPRLGDTTDYPIEIDVSIVH
jgi:hypothetical protein